MPPQPASAFHGPVQVGGGNDGHFGPNAAIGADYSGNRWLVVGNLMPGFNGLKFTRVNYNFVPYQWLGSQINTRSRRPPSVASRPAADSVHLWGAAWAVEEQTTDPNNGSRSSVLLSMWLLVVACGEEQSTGAPPRPRVLATGKAVQALAVSPVPPRPPRSNRTSYQEIRGGGLQSNGISLCGLLKFYTGGAGAYRVTAITSYTEELLDLPGNNDGFTYVELELVADWSGTSPANPVVRIVGGPTTADITKSWLVSLRVGEVVGLLLEAPSPRNRGFLGMHPLATFREKSTGGYSNEQLFTKQAASLDAIGHTVQNLVTRGADCAQQDVLPDLDGLQPVVKVTAVGPPVVAPTGQVPSADGAAP